MQSFRIYLQNELLSRISNNSSYSLRAFAKFLEINDSTLSKILNGKLKITKKRFNQLSRKLDLSIEDLKKFNQFNLNLIDESRIQILSDWYYFALLELIKTKDFKNDVSWISGKLSISVSEVNFALEKLILVGFIKVNENDEIELLSSNNKWNGDQGEMISRAHRAYQKKIITKSLETLDLVGSDEKENSSLTVACSRKLVPEIKEKISNFKKELDEYILNSEYEHNDVYQLSLSFFPITMKNEVQGDNYVH